MPYILTTYQIYLIEVRSHIVSSFTLGNKSKKIFILWSQFGEGLF
jgi:hypothetical protein